MKKIVLATLIALLVSASGSAMAKADDYEDAMAILETTELQKIQFRGESILDVLEYLAEASGLDFVPSDQLTEEPPEVSINLNKGVPVRNFIKVVSQLTEPKLKFYYEDGVIMVATADEVVQKPVLRIYDVGGLKIQIPDFPGPEIMLTTDSGFEVEDAPEEENEPLTSEELSEIIQNFVGAGTWDNEEVGATIEVRGTQLLVMQIPQVHDEIAALLAQLGD